MSRITEIQRILSMPKSQIDVDGEEGLRLAAKWSEHFRIAGGHWNLFPAQGAALEEVFLHGHLLGSIGVGKGKTLLALLIPKIFGIPAYKTVILGPSNFRKSLLDEAAKYLSHFDIETELHVVSYNELSDPDKGVGLLDKLRPDLIIADEAHELAGRGSARRKRLIRYFQKRPECRFVAMSGTITKHSLKDMSDMGELALRENTPIPRTYGELDAWSACIDVSNTMNIPSEWQWEMLQPLWKWSGGEGELGKQPIYVRKKNVQLAFEKRFSSAPGVVVSRSPSCDATVVFKELTKGVHVPKAVLDLMKSVQDTWELEDGIEIEDQLDFARTMRQLTCGFYYYRDWPDGVVDRDWLYAKREWSKQLRMICRRGFEGYETKLLICRGMEEGVFSEERYPDLWDALREWVKVADRPEPPTRTRWVSEYLIDQVEKWSLTHPKGLVFYEFGAVASALKRRGLRVVWAGQAPHYDGKAQCLSVKSHGQMWNLQMYDSMLIISPMASGSRWQQVIGRIHRANFAGDSVEVATFAHHSTFKASLQNAIASASYIQNTTGEPQRILYATKVAG